MYKADGDAHSWSWLGMIAQCIDVLRNLAKSVNAELGSRQGNKHAHPDLSRDIETLMNSLRYLKVYEIKEGRVLDDDEKHVAFALTHGAASSPLADFNTICGRARERRKLMPISELMTLVEPYDPLRKALFRDREDTSVPIASENQKPLSDGDEDGEWDWDEDEGHARGLLERMRPVMMTATRGLVVMASEETPQPKPLTTTSLISPMLMPTLTLSFDRVVHPCDIRTFLQR